MKKYILLAFCFVFFSCKNSTETGQSQGVIMPLAIGNTWIYLDNGYDSNGNVIVPAPSDTLLISDTISYGKDILYKPRNRDIYYTNKADGLWIRYGIAFSEEIFFAKYPAKVGDIFRHDSYILTKESSPDPIGLIAADFIVSSTTESVTVPAGTFVCYKYNADYYDTTSHQLIDRYNTFYAPNVGMIKSEDFHLDTITHTLKIAQTSQLTKVILH